MNACPSCGQRNTHDARFCNRCGHALDTSPIETEAERRQITVFFSDVSGFTAMSERLDPEDVRRVMNAIFGRAREIVEQYGGRIEKLLGDAVMAVFGHPVVHEDDPERAVRAVLKLHAAVDELSARVEPEIGRPIAMHTGVNTGLVVTASAEFDNAVGDAINVAARLADLAEPGEILLGPETAQGVAGVFSVEDRGQHALKGKSGTVAVTRVVGMAPTRAEPSRRQAVFVGRHEELGVLLSAVERMRDGASSVVTIRAEAGTGKTRLLAEFRQRLPDEVQWLEGRAYAYGENIPYAAVIDLLRRAVGINEDDDEEAIVAKLRAAVAGLVDDVDLVYGPLERLFGLAEPERAGLERETFRARLLSSVVALAEALAQRSPTVLIFQDLHWADPSTVDLIRDLIDRLHTPTVVIANYRPPFSLGASGQRELELRELSPRQTGELVSSLLDGRPPPEGLVDVVVARTEGNPFFAEEIVNRLIETGHLFADASGWKLAAEFDRADLPTSIRGVIAARIDNLDSRRRRVLREVSVVGREFLYNVVAGVTTMADQLDSSLKALEAADLIREKSSEPDLEYFFKHALTQEVAYDGLLKEEREQLHARAAAALERQFAGRLAEVAETLAYHWSRSGDAHKAVEHLLAAGRKAMERFALKESEAHYDLAYRTLLDEPDGEPKDRGLVELLLQWAYLDYYQGTLHALKERLIRHEGAVARTGEAEQQGMWKAWLGHSYWVAEGDPRKATEILDQALEMGRRSGNRRLIAYAQAWRVHSLMFLGRINEAKEAGAEGQRLGSELDDSPYAWFKSTLGLGTALAIAGDFDAARALADQLITFGDRTGSARSRASAGLILCCLAEAAADETLAAEAIRLAEDCGDPIYEHGIAFAYLARLVFAGHTTEARRYRDAQHQRYVLDRHLKAFARLLMMCTGVLMALEGRVEDGFSHLEAAVGEAAAADARLDEHYGAMLLALLYAGVATAPSGIGDLVRHPVFALKRGLHAKRQARARLDYILAHLDEWELGSQRFKLELTYARLLAHEGDANGAVSHLERAIKAIEPVGDTDGLRSARTMLEELTTPHGR